MGRLVAYDAKNTKPLERPKRAQAPMTRLPDVLHDVPQDESLWVFVGDKVHRITHKDNNNNFFYDNDGMTARVPEGLQIVDRNIETFPAAWTPLPTPTPDELPMPDTEGEAVPGLHVPTTISGPLRGPAPPEKRPVPSPLSPPPEKTDSNWVWILLLLVAVLLFAIL